ncbi:hypothetical protein ACLOJK_040435 [Asimina triloba]
MLVACPYCCWPPSRLEGGDIARRMMIGHPLLPKTRLGLLVAGRCVTVQTLLLTAGWAWIWEEEVAGRRWRKMDAIAVGCCLLPPTSWKTTLTLPCQIWRYHCLLLMEWVVVVAIRLNLTCR